MKKNTFTMLDENGVEVEYEPEVFEYLWHNFHVCCLW